MPTQLWYIKHANLFSWLADDEQRDIADRSEMFRCQRNSKLFFAEESSEDIYLIKEGRVKLTRTSATGREMILDILGPGEIFGELSLIGEENRSHSAVALDDALVCKMARSDFEGLLQRHPEMALKVIKLIGMRRRELEMRLEDLLFQPVGNRLALALLWQAQRHGISEENGSIRIPLSQKNLAHLIGSSRESVAEQLTKWKKSGLVTTSYRSIKIIDPQGLKIFFKQNSTEKSDS
ncbi:MAG: Crp/Fnr family transcriptional regulator [Geopsychrobacter sp.]|nr:Crp/Fnr family transcriptional regulator [Geopsychrobacter sp.]